jgi:hypothetical protein
MVPEIVIVVDEERGEPVQSAEPSTMRSWPSVISQTAIER